MNTPNIHSCLTLVYVVILYMQPFLFKALNILLWKWRRNAACMKLYGDCTD